MSASFRAKKNSRTTEAKYKYITGSSTAVVLSRVHVRLVLRAANWGVLNN